MELYKVDVHENVRKDGALLWEMTGSLVSVSGQEYVQLPHGTLVQRTPDWKDTKQEALNDAADRVEDLARILVKQAEAMREGSHAPA